MGCSCKTEAGHCGETSPCTLSLIHIWLELTEAEYQETLGQFSRAIEVTPEEYESQMGRAWIEREALTRKVMEYLVTQAVITE